MMKKLFSVLVCFSLLLCLYLSVHSEENELDRVLCDTADYIVTSYPSPSVGSVGGEWAVMGLARSGEEVPEGYFEKYYENVKKYVAERGGILSSRKYTEYSRLVIALTAIGKDPRNAAEFDLVAPLLDYDSTVRQGLNGAIFALIAIDCGNFLGEETAQAREKYTELILKRELDGGGWALSGEEADADVTAMALQALAGVSDKDGVKAAIDRGVEALSEMQKQSGGFETVGTETSESTSQVITALCENGISPFDDRFTKSGNTLFDALMTYYVPKSGFKHVHISDSADEMATEQAFYALAALRRFIEGKSSLYRMTGGENAQISDETQLGLSGKHKDVQKRNIVSKGKTFIDLESEENKKEIESLAERGIINGKSDEIYDPSGSMTRAEYAAIAVRSLGLPVHTSYVFSDVAPSDWFYEYIGTAYYYGIVNGISESEFDPNGTITREEACVMTARAARLAGFDETSGAFYADSILSSYKDSSGISDWAVRDVAFCIESGIINESELEIRPKDAVTRSDVAYMIYNMLLCSGLI